MPTLVPYSNDSVVEYVATVLADATMVPLYQLWDSPDPAQAEAKRQAVRSAVQTDANAVQVQRE